MVGLPADGIFTPALCRRQVYCELKNKRGAVKAERAAHEPCGRKKSGEAENFGTPAAGSVAGARRGRPASGQARRVGRRKGDVLSDYGRMKRKTVGYFCYITWLSIYRNMPETGRKERRLPARTRVTGGICPVADDMKGCNLSSGPDNGPCCCSGQVLEKVLTKKSRMDIKAPDVDRVEHTLLPPHTICRHFPPPR